MEITDIRVKLIHESKERLRAVCSVTFDDAFVVRDVKVVEGTSGTFVAMPSRKLSAHCPKCRHKNQIRARFCNECGGKLPPPRPPEDGNGRSRFHRDIAHPINTEFREMIQKKVLEAFEQEVTENRDTLGESSHHDEDTVEQRSDQRVAVETADESADAQERPKIVEERSEYDSLIAGLDAGGRGRLRESSGTDRSREGGGPDRSERNDKERKRGGQGRGQPVRRKEETAERPATPPKPQECVNETSVADAADDNDDTQFGVDIAIETQTPTETITTRKPEPIAEVVEVIEDDDTGFGAGLV